MSHPPKSPSSGLVPADPLPTGRMSAWERSGLFLGRSLDKRLTRLGVWLYRRTKGGITRPWNVDALLLTTRGRRSGRERTVVLQFFRDDPAMVVVAANDGGARQPAWYLNLIAEPGARVEVMGRTILVRAEEIAAAESPAWWERILRRAPSYERYRRATTRPFPIVRLVPSSGSAAARTTG